MAAICAGLEGLPLAIELAAARAADLSMRELREAMSAQLRLLAGGRRDLPLRQRTSGAPSSGATSSFPMTSKPLLRRLSVFAGGFTSEAAEQIWSTGDDEHSENSDALLRSLVDKSLVKREIARVWTMKHVSACWNRYANMRSIYSRRAKRREL